MSGPHWAVLAVDKIVIAQGYCWCDHPDSPPHAIGIRPNGATS